MTSRLQVSEAIATGGDVRAAKRAYYGNPTCSCCETAPVPMKRGRNRETGETYEFRPDLCDECWADASATIGWRNVKRACLNARFERPR